MVTPQVVPVWKAVGGTLNVAVAVDEAEDPEESINSDDWKIPSPLKSIQALTYTGFGDPIHALETEIWFPVLPIMSWTFRVGSGR